MASSMFRTSRLLGRACLFSEQQAGCHHHSLNMVKGDIKKLPRKVRRFVEERAAILQPDNVFIMDGSLKENKQMLSELHEEGVIHPLSQYHNNWLARTDPRDVARVESKTVISTTSKRETIPIPKDGVKGVLGHWMSPDDLQRAFKDRFPGCMKGRTMYVLPYSMGPVGSPLSKIGVELTDSAYVAVCMRIMTRLGQNVLDALGDDDFIKCMHSIGQPLPMKKPAVNNWPCNPEKVLIAHIPDEMEISSFGSGYGGNSLLGKKCFSLRIGSTIARKEGWLAEHMLILGITTPEGRKHYIAAAFPSACGKTNLAMMNPELPGYKVECVGDDIAWMRFDEEGVLRAINPESGFFGVCPGTSMKTNPNAMHTIQKNSIFTNVAERSDGRYYWEGIGEDVPPDVTIHSWTNEDPWCEETSGPAAHPNSRFCTPAEQCPMIDPEWESPRGVPIEAIVFGGRRPEGVPLVYEAFDWQHGVLIGGAMKSEATAAAEHKAKVVMHDPFAMRPFFGYNFGHYMSHWLSMAKHEHYQLPRIFHANWFRKNDAGKFIWPGFGDNVRVLDWIVKRCEGVEGIAEKSAIGYLPKRGTINVDGLEPKPDMDHLFNITKEFWQAEAEEIGNYFDEQVGDDLPAEVSNQLNMLKERVNQM